MSTSSSAARRSRATHVASTLFWVLSLLCGGRASAQRSASPPERPTLDSTAPEHDPRDWRAYLGCGLDAASPTRAHACLYWAARLDPSRAEPAYAEWARSDGTDGAARRRALTLDAFMIQARVRAAMQPRAGLFTGEVARAWNSLSSGDYFGASAHFAQHLIRNPDDTDARWGHAVALYYRDKFDSSAAQLRTIELALRDRRGERLSTVNQPLLLLAYMQGVAGLRGGRHDLAHAALRRALADDETFYPARMLLADRALADGDTAAAEREWTRVRALLGNDAVARRRYAKFLLATAGPGDAERELRAVLEAEPDWIDARLDLGLALAAQGAGARDAAVEALADFLGRAPESAIESRRVAGERIASLRRR